jgi:hypothetical protein
MRIIITDDHNKYYYDRKLYFDRICKDDELLGFNIFDNFIININLMIYDDNKLAIENLNDFAFGNIKNIRFSPYSFSRNQRLGIMELEALLDEVWVS